MTESNYHGLLVIDKPSGMTSRDVVNRVQGWFPQGTRIGHTGTLDPLATGVLVLCIGKANRLAEYVQRMKKTYVTRLLLGATSDTDDAEGTVMPAQMASAPNGETVARCLEEFIGEIEQTPPAFSAARINGQRAYDLARRGKEVSLEPRRVWIYSIELICYDYPSLDLRIECGKGTYIRSLARDLGNRFGVGALVQALRRTRIGPFEAKDALILEADSSVARNQLLPLAAAVSDLPRLELDADQSSRLLHGQKVTLPILRANLLERDLAVFDHMNRLIAIASIDSAKRLVIPMKVLYRAEGSG
jgi:tRNA pseudouridine55 synthase